MKNKKLHAVSCILVISSLICSSSNAQLKDYSAQYQSRATAKQPSTLGSNPGGNPDVPVDGGISLLVGAGVLLGAKRMKNNKQSGNPV